MIPLGRVGILARLRVIDPLFFLWTYTFQLKLTITRPLGRAYILNGVKISNGKSLTMSHFCPPNYQNIETCFKLAGELANGSKLGLIANNQWFVPRFIDNWVVSHHRQDIDKVIAQCLLAGNYPSLSHRQNDSGVGPLKIEMDPLKLVFYTFKGSKRPLLFGAQC